MALVVAQPHMIQEVISHLSKADCKELELEGISTEFAQSMLMDELDNNAPMWAFVWGWDTLAIGGVVDGQVWLLTSKYAETESPLCRFEMLSAFKRMIAYCLEHHGPVLKNRIWKGNRKHIAMVRHLGAIFTGETLIDGEVFVNFEFHKEV